MSENNMHPPIDRKLSRLQQIVRDTGGLAVAFSGGVDSTFLTAVAHQELGERSLAVTAFSPLYPMREQREAEELAQRIGIRHETVVSDELGVPGFADNPPDRCYLCKSELFTTVRRVAERHGIHAIADGTNAADLTDFRPGRRAAAEHNVLSPLLEADLHKDQIRELSRRMGLPTADKAAFACLASRFPYGSRITVDQLAAVETVEDELRELGFSQCRVRCHGNIARVEVDTDDISRVSDEPVRTRVVAAGRRAGFDYVALDLEGYRTGSMNRTLTTEQKGTRP